MHRTRLAAPRAARLDVTSLVVAASLGALAVFAAGHHVADLAAPPPVAPSPVPAPGEVRAPGAALAASLAWPRPGGPPPSAPAAAVPGAPAEAPARPGRPAPALVSQVTEAARLGLEAWRADLVARCVPAARQAAGGSVPFTFNLTFDQDGREIARGIGEDRRARAPEVASCLRRLPLGSLRVPAPGARVGVRVALALP